MFKANESNNDVTAKMVTRLTTTFLWAYIKMSNIQVCKSSLITLKLADLPTNPHQDLYCCN